MAFSKTIEKKKLIIHCDVCFEEITLRPFIKCAECIWEQCIDCFLKEIETDLHKKTHSFRIINNMDKTIFDANWRMIDELIFLNGTIKFGVGNFEDLSFVLSKPICEVKTHFFWLTGLVNNEEGEIERNNVARSEPYDTEVLSYMPERRDFESEIHNEYEALIAGLKFLKNDTETERDLKKHMLNNYRVILRQRRMWKEFILDRNLIRVNAIKANEIQNGIGKITSKHKWLSGYLSKNDFNYFITCLVEEERLRRKVESEQKHGSVIGEDRGNIRWENIQKKESSHEGEIMNVEQIIGDKEKEFCKRLNISIESYAEIKAYALECYIMKVPFKKKLFELFDKSENERVELLYKWFENQKITFS